MNVLIISPMPEVAEKLKELIATQPGVQGVREAGDASSGLRMIRESATDVAVIDMQAPLKTGIGIVRRMLALSPCLKIIALSMHADSRYLVECLAAGVCGYILTDCAYEELTDALQVASPGCPYVSKSLRTPLPAPQGV